MSLRTHIYMRAYGYVILTPLFHLIAAPVAAFRPQNFPILFKTSIKNNSKNCRESRDGHENAKKYTNKGSRDNNKYKGHPYIISFFTTYIAQCL